MKKGNAILETAVIMAVIFAIIIAVIILKFNVMDPVNEAIQEDTDFHDTSKVVLNDYNTRFSTQWDYAIAFLLVGFWMVALVSARFIDSYPIFFVFSIFGLIIVFSVTMILESTYTDITSESDYAGESTSFPLVHGIMQNFLIIMIIVGFSIAVSLYAK